MRRTGTRSPPSSNRAMRRITLAGALGVGLIGALAMPAAAQMDSREGIALQNQILELRRDMQSLQRGSAGSSYPVPSSGGGGSGLQSQLLDRVQTLEDQVRRLRGQLDEQANTSRRAQEALSKQIDDLSFKLGNTASGGSAAAPATRSAPSPAEPAASQPPKRTPELALQEGNAALARRDYPAAESAAREVLSTKNAPRSGDANFLLAQSQMGQRNFAAAAVSYDDAYQRSRTGSRAPDALLGLANALTGLNDRNASCATLDKLRREFSTLRPAVRETAATLRSRNGCS